MGINYEEAAADYARHRALNGEVLKGLLTTGGIQGGSKVLEVGCGTGNYVIALQELAGCSCRGIDPSEQMLAKAKDRSARVTFPSGTAESLDFPADTFDFVFSVDVIHHVGDRLRYFQEAFRVLKAGGRICTVTDSEWVIRRREVLSKYFPETVEVELRRYPPVAKLREMMAKAGFAEVAEMMAKSQCQIADCQAYRAKAFSSLHLISEDAFQRGIERLEQDLRAGPISFVERYLMLWGRRPFVP
jgi:ubiquinone/menaquinone biosynthesis C-methylase UbiE